MQTFSVVQVRHSGWYSCNATNLEGSQAGHIYLHVARPGDQPLNLTGLQYPMIPQHMRPETPTAVTSHPVTTSLTFQLNITSSLSNATDRLPSAGSEFSTVTSAHARWTGDTGSTFTVADDRTTIDGVYFTTESPYADSIWKKVLLIVGCVLGGIILLILLFVSVIGCVRLARKCQRRRRRTKSVPPAPRTIRDDCIRRPKPFPGISMADQGDGQPLQASALPVSPSYPRPERLDLLSAEFDRDYDQMHTFERKKNGNGVENGCT